MNQSANTETSSAPQQIAALLSGMQVHDLSQSMQEDMPAHPNHSRFFRMLWTSTATGNRALTHQLLLNEHSGTHIDATAHFLEPDDPGYAFMDETPVQNFFGRALTLDFSSYVGDREVTVAEVEEWEQASGLTIGAGDMVLFHFGWDRHWVPRSESREYAEVWPGILASTADFLVQRGIKVLGSDTISIDGSASDGSPCHYTLLGSGVNLVENLTNLGSVLGESYLFLAPLKIAGGSGAPLRALAFT